MQLLYANDGINYRTISKSFNLSTGVEKELLGSYLKYDFVTNQNNYSSIENEPEAISYAVSNLNNELPKNCVIVCKAGHMSKMASPSYYFHAVIEELNDDFFKEDFFRIFNYHFVKDSDINVFNDRNIDQFVFSKDNSHQVCLNDEQLITILSLFMYNEKNNHKTKIIVDARGDQYNRRSREILASIYHFLPYELRRRYGFLSYAKENEAGSGKVSFVLYAADEIKTINDTYIDLHNIDLDSLAAKIDKQYLNYARYLVSELDDTKRKAHFEKLSTISKNGRLKISECLTYYTNLNKWLNGTQEKLLPEWVNYVEQNSFRKGPLFEMMIEIINDKVDNDYYNQYLINNNLELYQDNLTSLSLQSAKVIRFADYFDHLKIDESKFILWYFKQFSNHLVNPIDLNNPRLLIEYKNNVDNEIIRLQKVDIGSNQLPHLIALIIERLNTIASEVNQKLDEYAIVEADQIGKEIANLRYVSLDEFSTKIVVIKNNMFFEENQDIFSAGIIEWLQNYLTNKLTEKQLNKLEQFVTGLKNDINDRSYTYFVNEINRRLISIIERRKSLTFTLTNRSTVLDNCLILKRNLDEEIIKIDDRVNVAFGYQTINMSVYELKQLLKFILVPFAIKNNFAVYLEYLFANNMLTVEHFEPLIQCIDEENEYIIKKIVDYYFKARDSIEISGLYVYNILSMYKPHLLKRLVDYYENDQRYEVVAFVEMVKRGNKRQAKAFNNAGFDDYSDDDKPKAKKKGFNIFKK